MNRRRIGQGAAAIAALAAFVWAFWWARAASIPELRVYDGYWMILGASLAVLAVAPLVWRWPREISLPMVAITSVLGSVAALSCSAIRHHIPILARLRGAWVLGGADGVGPALVIGFTCLWLAIRPHRAEASGSRHPGSR